jgi:hypothetical protein
VTFIGLNIDKDKNLAAKLARDRDSNWSQNYLGESSDMARQLAISSAPAYYLIGPDGTLVASSTEWKELAHKLNAAMKRSVAGLRLTGFRPGDLGSQLA